MPVPKRRKSRANIHARRSQWKAEPVTLVKTVEANNTNDKIEGTPTFFLNGKKIDGTTWEVVEPLLKSAGAR